MSNARCAQDSSKSRLELGLEYRSLETYIVDTVNSLLKLQHDLPGNKTCPCGGHEKNAVPLTHPTRCECPRPPDSQACACTRTSGGVCVCAPDRSSECTCEFTGKPMVVGDRQGVIGGGFGAGGDGGDGKSGVVLNM